MMMRRSMLGASEQKRMKGRAGPTTLPTYKWGETVSTEANNTEITLHSSLARRHGTQNILTDTERLDSEIGPRQRRAARRNARGGSQFCLVG